MQEKDIPQGPQRLWTKHYILIIFFSIVTGISNFMMTTGTPLYAIKLGGNNSIAGLMMGVFMTFAILVRPFFGNLADRKSRRLVLMTGTIFSTVAFFSYSFAFSVGILLFIRAVHGIGFSANTNASGTVVSDIIPKSRLIEGIGYFGISNVLATAVGPALTLYIIKTGGYRVLFSVAAGLGIISFLSAFFLNYEKKRREELPKEDGTRSLPGKKRVKAAIFEKKAIPPSFVMLFVALAMGGVQSFIPIYAASRGIESIGIYFTFFALALLFTRLFGGRIADRYGPSIVILPGYILLIISFIVLAMATSIPLFILSGVLYGLGLGLVQPILNAIMIQSCPADRRGAGNSTFFTAMDLGSGGGAVLWGVVSQHFGFSPVYFACTGSVLLSGIFFFVLLHRKATSH